jgi:protoporphyrinogen oxidase
MKIAVIGAGPMGLACVYELLKAGHAVDLYEAGERIGGMSASFDFDGLQIERYYHFICRPDQPMFDLLEELGLSDQLRWRETKMGFFYQGKLYRWGNPLYLLTFPGLGLISKLRYALNVLRAKNATNLDALDRLPAIAWLKSQVGEKAYAVLWDSLFRWKFYEWQDQLSAAWIASRVRRVALSRRSLFSEELGYLQGGSETLLREMERRINGLGGRILLRAPVQKVLIENGRTRGLQINDEQRDYDRVVSTIPLPYIPRIAPDLPAETLQQIQAIKNVGVACVLLKLRQPLSENFWMNINDPGMEIPGVIEYSNLNPLPHSLLYVPFYMPVTHPKYSQDNGLFIREVLGYLPRLNPAFREDWVLAATVSRYEYAQTVCPPGFLERLPPMRSAAEGFFMADTAYYYPEDRSIAESVKVGQQLARMAGE